MRRFNLTNALGETWDLQQNNVCFFAEPDGLGWVDNTEYVRAGNNYAALELQWEQRELEGTIFFLNKPYEYYLEFTKFARRVPLTMEYMTGAGMTYKVRCRLSEIEKSEINEYHVLECPVTFKALGPFYKPVAVYNAGEASTVGKTYDYTYDYTYSDNIGESITIMSDAVGDSPCKVTIYGPCTNPVWRHYVNGELYATGSMTGEVASGDVLVIDSTSLPYSVTERDLAGNLIADRYQLCDFGTERFFFLQYGTNVINISHSSTETCALRVEAQISYASV